MSLPTAKELLNKLFALDKETRGGMDIVKAYCENSGDNTPDILTSHRIKLGLSRPDVYKLTGIADGTLKQWENGTNTPNPHGLLNLIRFYQNESTIHIRELASNTASYDINKAEVVFFNTPWEALEASYFVSSALRAISCKDNFSARLEKSKSLEFDMLTVEYFAYKRLHNFHYHDDEFQLQRKVIMERLLQLADHVSKKQRSVMICEMTCLAQDGWDRTKVKGEYTEKAKGIMLRAIRNIEDILPDVPGKYSLYLLLIQIASNLRDKTLSNKFVGLFFDQPLSINGRSLTKSKKEAMLSDNGKYTFAWETFKELDCCQDVSEVHGR